MRIAGAVGVDERNQESQQLWLYERQNIAKSFDDGAPEVGRTKSSKNSYPQ